MNRIKSETITETNVSAVNTSAQIEIPRLFFSPGAVLALGSLIAGCLALLFSLAPLAIGWFAAIFWLIYPLSALSLVLAIRAYFFHKIWMPTIGLALSLASIMIAIFLGSYYVLAMAGSVNGLTRIAKTFIDALVWPF
ncbi:MAG: hypothetical protein K2M13_10265 [Muribaculaceae bacterium]|nr:hypothetical protein [Muribaculaceae bacterium]